MKYTGSCRRKDTKKKMRIICNSIGLNIATEVISGKRKLVTQGLSIKQLCDLWKWYYSIPPFKKVELVFSADKDYYAINQKTFARTKSVKEMFEKEGFICKKLP